MKKKLKKKIKKKIEKKIEKKMKKIILIKKFFQTFCVTHSVFGLQTEQWP